MSKEVAALNKRNISTAALRNLLMNNENQR